MFRIAALLVFAASLATNLAACDAVSTLSEGLTYAHAVESDLEGTMGMKPQVGFRWTNGRLVEVSVNFPRLYYAQPIREAAEMVRVAVSKEFKQAPENIVLSFSLGRGSPPTAQLSRTD
jgi:hypothetical protein